MIGPLSGVAEGVVTGVRLGVRIGDPVGVFEGSCEGFCVGVPAFNVGVDGGVYVGGPAVGTTVFPGVGVRLMLGWMEGVAVGGEVAAGVAVTTMMVVTTVGLPPPPPLHPVNRLNTRDAQTNSALFVTCSIRRCL